MPSPEEMQKLAEKMQAQGGVPGALPPAMPGLPSKFPGLPSLGAKFPGLSGLPPGFPGLGKKK
jgi:signal recognition particle subunit SRP54